MDLWAYTAAVGACPWRIRKSRRDWHLEQTAAMVPPSVVRKDGMGGQRLARTFPRSTAIERLVNAMFVVINPEFFQLLPQVDRVPDQYLVKELPSYRPDQSFHERMGYGNARDRLDPLDLQKCASWQPNGGSEIMGRGRNSGAEEATFRR
jgi:hypothetical protein